MSITLGMLTQEVVGSHVELVSSGSSAHQAQLCAGLEANGIKVDNAPKGNMADFAMANAKGYELKELSVPSNPAPAVQFGKSLG